MTEGESDEQAGRVATLLDTLQCQAGFDGTCLNTCSVKSQYPTDMTPLTHASGQQLEQSLQQSLQSFLLKFLHAL